MQRGVGHSDSACAELRLGRGNLLRPLYWIAVAFLEEHRQSSKNG